MKANTSAAPPMTSVVPETWIVLKRIAKYHSTIAATALTAATAAYT